MICQKNNVKAEAESKADIQKSVNPVSSCLTEELVKVKSKGKETLP